jgi:hypothetical protein
VEELELVDHCDRHRNPHPPFTGNPEFQQSEANEGKNALIGHSS